MNDRVLGGRYRLLEEVGTGGMAVVYRARDELLGREVAVKVLREQYAADEVFLQSFQREARAAAALSHPNIVNVHDVGVEDGVHFIVMELVEGTTLKEVIKQHGRLGARAALGIARQIATALAEAHGREIIHRDIKPQNILITPDGLVKVADFGIARAQSLAQGTISNSDSVVGSVHYVSPEQATGKDVEGRSDLYSLGVVLYEMVTGQVPFAGTSPVGVAYKHVEELPCPPSRLAPVPAVVEAVIMRALAKVPRDRFGGARAMCKAIIEAEKSLPEEEEDQDTLASLTTCVVPAVRARGAVARGARRRQWRNRAILATAAAAVVVLVVLAAQGLVAWLNPPEVVVPDVLGKPRLEGIRELQAVGLRVREEPAQHSPQPAGQIIKTDPEGLQTVKQGREIKIWVSLGPQIGFVPEVTSLTEREALLALENYGLVAGEIERRFDRTTPEGVVIDQNPKADIQVPAGTAVDLFISKGPEPTSLRMPSLLGQHITQALEEVESLGLVEGLVVERESSTYPIGSVMSQTPLRNSEIQEGARVDLVVSRGTGTAREHSQRFEVPTDLQGEQEIKIRLFVDAKTPRWVYWRSHSPGETVSCTIEWVGANARIKIYIIGSQGTQEHEHFL